MKTALSPASSLGPLAEQKSPVLELDTPQALNMTLQDCEAVTRQLQAFVAATKRREVEATLAQMSDDDYMSTFKSIMKGGD